MNIGRKNNQAIATLGVKQHSALYTLGAKTYIPQTNGNRANFSASQSSVDGINNVSNSNAVLREPIRGVGYKPERRNLSIEKPRRETVKKEKFV